MSAGVLSARPVRSLSMRLASPDSTLPEPHSTSISTPCDFMYCTLSRQRTRPVTCSTSRCLMAAGSVISAASTLATSGTRGVASDTVSSAAFIASAAGCISGQWKGALTGSSMPRLAPLGLGHLDGALDGFLVAAHHDLPAAIVVGDGDDLAERRLLAGLLGRLELDAEQGRHRADADRDRLLHRLAAQLQKPRGVCELQGAGGGQGRVFAQRMAGDMGRQAGQRLAAILFQDARRSPC